MSTAGSSSVAFMEKEDSGIANLPSRIMRSTLPRAIPPEEFQVTISPTLTLEAAFVIGPPEIQASQVRAAAHLKSKDSQ